MCSEHVLTPSPWRSSFGSRRCSAWRTCCNPRFLFYVSVPIRPSLWLGHSQPAPLAGHTNWERGPKRSKKPTNGFDSQTADSCVRAELDDERTGRTDPGLPRCRSDEQFCWIVTCSFRCSNQLGVILRQRKLRFHEHEPMWYPETQPSLVCRLLCVTGDPFESQGSKAWKQQNVTNVPPL